MFEDKEKTMNIFVFKMKRSLIIHHSSEGAVCGYGRPFTTLLHLEESHDSGDAKKKKGFVGDIFCN